VSIFVLGGIKKDTQAGITNIPAAAAAALLPAGQVLIGAAALAQILAAVQNPPHVAVARAPCLSGLAPQD
jgi:hypothetical protein